MKPETGYRKIDERRISSKGKKPARQKTLKTAYTVDTKYTAYTIGI